MEIEEATLEDWTLPKHVAGLFLEKVPTPFEFETRVGDRFVIKDGTFIGSSKHCQFQRDDHVAVLGTHLIQAEWFFAIEVMSQTEGKGGTDGSGRFLGTLYRPDVERIWSSLKTMDGCKMKLTTASSEAI